MAKTARIELRVDESFTKAVESLAKKTHRSKAEVIRDAMNLYIKAMDEWEKGRKIVFEPVNNTGKRRPAIETISQEPADVCIA
jgi:hypothetical protein